MKITKLFDYSVPLTAAATVLAIGAITVACIGAYTAYNIKVAGDSVVVTGSAKQAVVADTARWAINVETQTGVYDQQTGYKTLETATEKIVQHLEKIGITDYETPSVTTYPNYSYPQYSEPVLTGYNVSRQIIVRDSDIEKVNQLANNIEPLSGSGYNVVTQSVELTYSKLDEVRVTLLSEAIKDAKARAEAIAKDSGRSIGTLRSASSGVVQVLPAGSIDISDYGMYDTQSMKKEIMVTVRATFDL